MASATQNGLGIQRRDVGVDGEPAKGSAVKVVTIVLTVGWHHT